MFTNRDSATITRLVISWSFGFTQQSPTRLVISWSFEFTQQSPAWWSLGPLGSYNNHPPGDLLVLWVHTTITRLVISWSLGFTQQSPAWWSPGRWVHTTITRLVISWSFGFTQNEIAWLFTWNSIKVHVLGCCCAANRISFACHSNTYLAVTYATKHIWQSPVPSTYSIQIIDPRLDIFPSIFSLKAILHLRAWFRLR